VGVLKKQQVSGRAKLADRGNCSGATHEVAKLPVCEPMELNAEGSGRHDAAIKDAPCLVRLSPEALPEVLMRCRKCLKR
jgi:hypothetical protein